MNMGYCRFENTLTDLIDCKEALKVEEISSTDEMYAAIKLVRLCREIGNSVTEDDIRNFLENKEEEE